MNLLKSLKKPIEFGSDGGEKKVGDIGCSELGSGDNIPGNQFALSTPGFISIISMPCTSSKFSSLICCFILPSGDFVFSIAANLAAGEITVLMITGGRICDGGCCCDGCGANGGFLILCESYGPSKAWGEGLEVLS
ncbi:hypothetical protein F3Y22_tig00110776pilonHSYRG00023 [Hibiscus syriacus]|uniref:Uncharacterized protein n=1 Tax=Hibiscus syriacus TaxID=106335 RepID=A0A6A2ZTY6_HIBSY|nr:hypothetical protein F3Y22_tig00110776pilonHSYRG00023 [Hibiscus syriacus]